MIPTETFKPEMFSELARTAHDPKAAEKAAALLNGDLDPEFIPETAKWVRDCYARPRQDALVMHAVNAVLDGHGVEPIRAEGHYVSAYYGDIIATYVNFGDTYCLTVVLDSDGEFHLTSWGDFYENWLAENPQEVDDDDL